MAPVGRSRKLTIEQCIFVSFVKIREMHKFTKKSKANKKIGRSAIATNWVVQQTPQAALQLQNTKKKPTEVNQGSLSFLRLEISKPGVVHGWGSIAIQKAFRENLFDYLGLNRISDFIKRVDLVSATQSC